MTKQINQHEQSDLIFQLIDIQPYHEIGDDDEPVYFINLFGKTLNGESVCLKIEKFPPFFYINIPDNWNDRDIDKYINFVKINAINKVKYNPNLDYKSIEDSLLNYKICEKFPLDGFCNYQKKKFVVMTFKSLHAMRIYDNVIRKGVKVYRDFIKLKRFESNIEPHIRFLHLRNLTSCGWVKISHNKLTIENELSYCNINYSCNWKDVDPYECDNTAPLIIGSFDIECQSSDSNFPQYKRDGDKVIQIGLTLNQYGKLECHEKHIVTLKSCDNIKNANVYACNTERELLLKFVDLIRKTLPDILVGYNIFGFDELYMYKRAKKLGIQSEMISVGKLKNYTGKFVKRQLSSSALGDNMLCYFEMAGIVQIDILKEIQKNHKLQSYKLDDVAANFIKEEIKKVQYDENKTVNSSACCVKIYCSNIKGLQEDSFINIIIDDGLYPSKLRIDSKYKVLKMEQCNDTEYSLTIEISQDEFNELSGYTAARDNTIGSKQSFDAALSYTMSKEIKLYWTLAKDDFNHHDINRCQREDSKARAQIAKYCLKDCELVNILTAKLDVVSGNMGMAKVCHVPLTYLFLRGQGVKSYSLVAKKCREKSFLVPVMEKMDENGDNEGYEGAAVIEPLPKIYEDEPIAVLDFNSLYPNSIRARNMSPETLVKDMRYYNLPGEEYFVVQYKEKGKMVTKYYVKPKDNTGNGIIPEILTELLNARAETNSRMKIEKDPFKKKNLNSLQLAYKITANSIYGQLGASTSPIKCKDIAASTTAIGRDMLINYAKEIVENEFKNSKVIYGDSVTGDTPLILRDNNKNITVITIQDLGNNWIPYEEFKSIDITGKNNIDVTNRKDKQQSSCNYEIWTHQGWSQIKRVIRHKTIKKIYSVVTNSGIIDVTEDHSLLTNNLELIKPNECTIGTELLHSFMEFNDSISQSQELCDPSLLKKAYAFGCSFRIDSDGDLPNDAYKIIPQEILNGTNSIKTAFIDGYIGYFGDNECGTVIKGKINSQCLFYLLKSLGYDVSIDLLNDYTDIYKLSFNNAIETSNKLNKNVIKKINLLHENYTDFVYDIETDAGTFHAGIGELIVKNTDSIFINFNIRKENKSISDKEIIMEAIRRAKICEGIINKKVPPPQKIVYEKTFYPFILVSKKKYVGNKYEDNPDKYVTTSMGMVVKRRDNAPIVKIVVGGIIKCILNEHSVEKSIQHTHKVLQNIIDSKYSMDKYVISKNLKAKYKNPDSIAHKVLADRMAQRDPGNAPQIGDRIPFIYVEKPMTGGKKKKKVLQGELIEHPDYVKEQKLKIDYLHYITNQIMNPAIQILELGTKKPEKIFQKYIDGETNRRLGKTNLNDFIKFFTNENNTTNEKSDIDEDNTNNSDLDNSCDSNDSNDSNDPNDFDDIIVINS
jgi:DNA polymerase elongation subunit (family B)